MNASERYNREVLAGQHDSALGCFVCANASAAEIIAKLNESYDVRLKPRRDGGFELTDPRWTIRESGIGLAFRMDPEWRRKYVEDTVRGDREYAHEQAARTRAER